MKSDIKELLIAGVDEAGRGPLAGPVFAAAVILDSKQVIYGLKDSKLLSAKRRENLLPIIQRSCLAWVIGRAEVHEIDAINILQATLLAMQRAIASLPLQPEKVLIDGNQLPKSPYSMEGIIDGDKLIPAISAASIIAKVMRDRLMLEYDAIYPEYGFAAHKGYATQKHLAALKKYGASPIHRKSFAPIKSIIAPSND